MLYGDIPIRAVFQSCLRGIAATWFQVELDVTQRLKYLQYATVKELGDAIIQRFTIHNADAYSLLTTVSLTLANVAAGMTLPMLIATVRGAARAIDKKGALNYSSSYAL